jgi:hypothetical protein
MRIADSPFLQGLSLAERRRIVLQAAAEQRQDIDQLVGDLFAGARTAVNDATRPLSYWADVARDQTRNPSPTPVNFWARQEALRAERDEAARGATGPLGLADRPGALRPGLGAGLTPVEFARGERQSHAPAPKIGLPPPPPIKTIELRDLLEVRSQITSPVGRIVDVVA